MSEYTPHPRPLTVLHGDLERFTQTQREVFVGTAGSVMERTNASGFRFYAHQFYDGEGKKRERYLAGPIGSPLADAAAAELKRCITDLKELVPSLRLLGREGYSLVDPRTYATLASLHNHGVFSAGALLIGSHAYGVLLNRLGVRAAAYATEDIDIARWKTLAFDKRPELRLLEMLRGSGLEYVEVPQLDHHQPSTSYKLRGRSTLHVDLLVPVSNETYPVISVPELGAHATGLPYLAYLLADSQPGMVMAREGCCAVRVPLPERFALHKLIVSRLRKGREVKATADVLQAGVLCAVLAETQSGALAEAQARIPKSARKHLAAALEGARGMWDKHPRVWEELKV